MYARGAFDAYKRWLAELGLTHVEISDGTVEIPRERKLELIADFARDTFSAEIDRILSYGQ